MSQPTDERYVSTANAARYAAASRALAGATMVLDDASDLDERGRRALDLIRAAHVLLIEARQIADDRINRITQRWTRKDVTE